MNLIILLSMPLVLALVVGIYLIVSIKKEHKHTDPKPA